MNRMKRANTNRIPPWTAAVEGSPDATVPELPMRDELPSPQIKTAPSVLPAAACCHPFV
jgi:hypothetical protein